MPCGPQMVRRELVGATHRHAAAPGITARKPCLGAGRVETSDTDRRGLHSVMVWLAWAVVSVAAAIAILSAL